MPQSDLMNMFTQALKATGQSVTSDNVAALMNIAYGESRYQPGVVNNWDTNAQANNPSEGLMQVTKSNFKDFGKGGSILNPYDNAVAAINYMVARYGSVANALAYRQQHGNY